MRDKKSNLSPKELFSHEDVQVLIPILEEANQIKFEEKPNYGKLRFLLEKILLDSDMVPDSKYSFAEPLLNQ